MADGSKIDFESSGVGHSYTAGIMQAADGQGGTSAQSFTIAVTEVAPTLPVDIAGPKPAAASQVRRDGRRVERRSSTDVNGPAVVYSLTDNAGGRFAIDFSTGVVTVANALLLDFENTAPGHAYTITAQSSDGTLASSQNFSIAVTYVAPTALPTDSNGAPAEHPRKPRRTAPPLA